MLEADISYMDISAVHYTHTHVDHVNDLAQLLFAAKYDENPRREPLLITGPPGFKDFHKRLVALYGDQVVSDKYEITIEELSRDERSFDDYTLKSRPTAHMISSIGYRIDDNEGASVACTGDTGYCDEVLELAKGVDVLIIEAALPPGYDIEGHLEPRAAGQIATEAGVDTLVVTHLYPICDRYDTEAEVRKSYKGRLLIAEDMLRISV
jgi:ribonuclease BN (tRNA processing enzyme)